VAAALAEHYAKALAAAVFAPNSGLAPEAAVTQLRDAEALVLGSKELQLALGSPAVGKQRKTAVVARLADELGLHRLVRNFLLVVVAHRRTRDLKDICRQFEAAVDTRLGWVPAEVTSARELGGPQRQEIERVLGIKLGKFIRATYRVDAGLIGGLRARVASREYDASLRGKLDSMRQRLAARH
jgi:F-type H+-transporting ATPase subunit delta